MKRVGNKSAQLARSASRRKKTSSRFQFDITIDSITGLKPGSTHYFKWTRGVKVASSSHFETPKDNDKNAPTSVNEKLSLLVTLYREDGKKFDNKESKLSLVAVNSKKLERTSCKTKFDLSQFAGVPSSSSVTTFKLSDRISAKLTIDSRFLKSGGSGPRSSGTSSALSSMDGVSVRSSDDDEHDDFGDLDVDDVPDPELPKSTSAATSSSSSEPSILSNGPSTNTTNNSSVARRQKSTLGSTATATTVTAKPTKQSRVTTAAPTLLSSSSSSSRQREITTTSSVTDGEKELTLLKKENERLLSSLTEAQKEHEKTVSELKKEKEKVSLRVLESERQREGEGTSLRRENDRLSSTLKDVQKTRSSSDMSTKLQIEALTSRLDERANQLENAVSERDLAKKDVQFSKEERDKARNELQNMKREANMVKGDVGKIESMTAERDEANQTVKEFRTELVVARRSLEEFRLRCKRLEGAEERCAELSREIDRLTVAAATGGIDSKMNGGQIAAMEEVEGRMAVIQEEKEGLIRKLRGFEAHSANIKSTFEDLSSMYTKLSDEHTILQKESVELRRMSREAQTTAEAGMAHKEENEKLRRTILEHESNRDNFQQNHDQILVQVDTLQDRLDGTTQALARAKIEVEEGAKEQEELKRQRDIAMQRALSKGKNSERDRQSSDSIHVAELEELRNGKQATEKIIEELRKEVGDLRDDMEYEKTEKAKAREERDKIREASRTLERKSSQATRATDALHSLKRELSSQQMRVQDYENMMNELKSENESLQEQLSNQNNNVATRDIPKDDVSDLLEELVLAKLAVAEAKSDKQQMEFEMRQLKKVERTTQQRLAAKASRMEVRLEAATQEIDRLKRSSSRSGGSGGAGRRSERNSHDAKEFNEFGSDVDY